LLQFDKMKQRSRIDADRMEPNCNIDTLRVVKIILRSGQMPHALIPDQAAYKLSLFLLFHGILISTVAVPTIERKFLQQGRHTPSSCICPFYYLSVCLQKPVLSQRRTIAHGSNSSFLLTKISAKFERGHPQRGRQM